MDAVNNPRAHAPAGFKLDPVAVEPHPVASREDVESTSPELPPGMLHYRPPHEDRRQFRGWIHAFVGCLSCLCVTAAVNFVAGFVIKEDRNAGEAAVAAFLVCLAPSPLFAIPGLWLRARRRWAAFLPGALTGWIVAALVEGLCFAALVNN